jgi:hypothetical protein
MQLGPKRQLGDAGTDRACDTAGSLPGTQTTMRRCRPYCVTLPGSADRSIASITWGGSKQTTLPAAFPELGTKQHVVRQGAVAIRLIGNGRLIGRGIAPRTGEIGRLGGAKPARRLTSSSPKSLRGLPQKATTTPDSLSRARMGAAMTP